MSTKTKKVTVAPEWLEMKAKLSRLNDNRSGHKSYVSDRASIKTAVLADPNGLGKYLLSFCEQDSDNYKMLNRWINPPAADPKKADKAAAKVYQMNGPALERLFEAMGWTPPKKK